MESPFTIIPHGKLAYFIYLVLSFLPISFSIFISQFRNMANSLWNHLLSSFNFSQTILPPLILVNSPCATQVYIQTNFVLIPPRLQPLTYLYPSELPLIVMTLTFSNSQLASLPRLLWDMGLSIPPKSRPGIVCTYYFG